IIATVDLDFEERLGVVCEQAQHWRLRNECGWRVMRSVSLVPRLSSTDDSRNGPSLPNTGHWYGPFTSAGRSRFGMLMKYLEGQHVDERIVVEETRRWVETVVIGLNLCPFARRPFAAGLIRFIVTPAATEEALLDVLTAELTALAVTPRDLVETTL